MQISKSQMACLPVWMWKFALLLCFLMLLGVVNAFVPSRPSFLTRINSRFVAASSEGDGEAFIEPPTKNVLGGALQACSFSPLTGYFRDGTCKTCADDRGSHTVCCRVTQAFLAYSKKEGNDLSTPLPQYGFAGLKPGDCWCLCASRWNDAYKAGVGKTSRSHTDALTSLLNHTPIYIYVNIYTAPEVVLAATHVKALDVCELDSLLEQASADSTNDEELQ